MTTLKEIKRIFVCETNTMQNPPFFSTLPPSGTVDLCKITVPVSSKHHVFLIHALVNWSITFTGLVSPVLIETPGFAQVTFELLRDGGPIQQVTATATQAGFNLFAEFVGPAATFTTTKLLHLDPSPIDETQNILTTFILRASNIILSPPTEAFGLGAPAATATAAAGPTALVVKEIELGRAKIISI